MTERFHNAVEAYRTRTQRAAGPDFAVETLDRLGLADRYLLLDSAIGPVYVTWNPRGVSAVRPAVDADAFERGDRSLDLDLRGCTPFETAVLRKAREIPAGLARSYAWIAR